MNDRFYIFTPSEDEQVWTKKFLKKIKKEKNIIYDGKTCYGIRIIPRKEYNPLLEIMVEDDGGLYSTDVAFDLDWVDGLINVLQEAKEYAQKLKGSENK